MQLKRPELLRKGCLIGDQWLENGSSDLPVTCPADGKEVIRITGCCTLELADKAVYIAHKTFNELRWTGRERSKLLRKWYDLLIENKDDLAQIISAETGKVIKDSYGEVYYAAQFCEWFAEEAPRICGSVIDSGLNDSRRIVTRRIPVGVCGIMTPWNFPLAMIMRKAAVAIAAGCTTIIRPSTKAPLATLAAGFLALEAGMPSGVINILVGVDPEYKIVEFLCKTPLIKKFSLTGSTKVGKHLTAQCASTLKKISMELGGNAPMVVTKTADIKLAVERGIEGRFRFSGQTCVCPNRFLIESTKYDDFVCLCLEKVKSLSVRYPDGDIGPLINQGAVDRMTRIVNDAVSKGGEIICGGKVIKDLGPLFFAPTIITGVKEDMLAWKEEIFGPIISIMKWDNETELLWLMNDTEVGLAGYVFAEDGKEQMRIAEKMQVGMVGINTASISEAAIPFGGVKETGYGREGSIYGIEDYTVLQSIAIQL